MIALLFSGLIFFSVTSQVHKHGSSHINKRDSYQANNTAPTDFLPTGAPTDQGAPTDFPPSGSSPPSAPVAAKICKDCSSSFQSCLQVCLQFTSSFCYDTCASNNNQCNSENIGCVKATPAPTNPDGSTSANTGSSYPTSSGGPSSSLSPAAIGGIVVGAIFGFLIILAVVVAFILYAVRNANMGAVDNYAQL